MKKSILFLLFIFLISISSNSKKAPTKKEIMKVMELTNKYFMDEWPDVGKTIITNRERESNIWTRAVYYEGLMALYNLNPKPEYYDYAVRWGEFHDWNLRGGRTFTRNADNQCAGQIYIDCYLIEPKPERVKCIKMSIDSMMNTSKVNDWNWIDAIRTGGTAIEDARFGHHAALVGHMCNLSYRAGKPVRWNRTTRRVDV